ncbi:siderophore receptor protein [Thiohalobacter sp. COW1]|uniref:Outer membrane receptor n=2 Tax=Thiohalobacteraceae TaxID=3085110 RepID=A0A1Z4VPS9_9GAMM|nr:outer membrane receptor [Thiohalobacter thiocyanaticus]BCO31727.1 siderophore receptor protein [Thiohalobacter sp. COW1]
MPANMPSPTIGVTAREMEEFNVVDTEDALKYAPNMVVRKRYIGDRNSIISVRGTNTRQSARSLVMADGLLLSNFLGSDFGFPPRWSMVNPQEIERVDVIYGPYSALYSGNSLGSTVLITTRMPTSFTADARFQAFRQEFDLYSTDASYGGHRFNGLVGDRAGRFSYLFTLDRLDNESHPMSFASLYPSTTPATGSETVVTGAVPDRDQRNADRLIIGYNSEGVDHTVQDQLKAKFAYDFTSSLQGMLTIGYWQQDRDSSTATYLRDAGGNPVFSGPISISGLRYDVPAGTFAPSNGEDARWLYGASLKTRNVEGWNFEATASLYEVTEDITRRSSSAGAGAGTVEYGDDTGWRTLDLRTDYRPAELVGGHWVSFGYHYDRYALENVVYDAVDWRAESLAGINSRFAGRTETQAVYAQDAWQMNDYWKLVLGARYERWQAFDGRRGTTNANISYPEREQSEWSPKASVEYAPDSPWLVRLSLARAYRFPTVSELFQGRVVGTTLVNNDPDLKPEEAFSKDLTFERFFTTGVLRLSLYEEDVRDVIMSQTNTTVFPNVTNIQNIDRVRTRGIELAWQGENTFIHGLDLNASVAYNHSETLENDNNPDTEGKNFYRIPRVRADLLATYHQTPKLSYTAAVRHSGRQYNTLDNSDTNTSTFGATSNFTVFDAKLRYAVNRQLQLGIGIENLTDERYFVYHPYPGRTLFAELKLSLN